MGAKEPERDRVGLCRRCRHARTVETRTSLFWMCERSKTDPRFEKYPRLPVVACIGFEPPGTGGSEGSDPAPFDDPCP